MFGLLRTRQNCSAQYHRGKKRLHNQRPPEFLTGQREQNIVLRHGLQHAHPRQSAPERPAIVAALDPFLPDGETVIAVQYLTQPLTQRELIGRVAKVHLLPSPGLTTVLAASLVASKRIRGRQGPYC